jgi:hypothetical protein
VFTPVRAGVIVGMGLLLALQPARAQSYEKLGRIHLSFSPDEIVQTTHVDAFQPFDVYVLADFDDTAMAKYVESGLRFDPSIAFGEVDRMGASQYVMVGLESGLVQLGFGWSCHQFEPGLTPVLRLRAVLQEDVTRALIGIEAVESGSFSNLGPGWVDCDDTHFLFGGSVDEWSKLEINGIVAVPTTTWGTVKAVFGKEAP